MDRFVECDSRDPLRVIAVRTKQFQRAVVLIRLFDVVYLGGHDMQA